MICRGTESSTHRAGRLGVGLLIEIEISKTEEENRSEK